MHVIQPTKVRSYARISSVVTLLFAPLTALSYFATKDGAESYDVASTKFWAHPARELLDPMLSFGSVDRVYATYVLVLAVMLPALPLAAWTVRRARAPFARIGERRASWVVAAAWSLFSAGLLIVGFAIQVRPSDTAWHSVVNLAFMIGVFPGLIIGVFGSLVLGIMLLRTDFAPRGSAVVIMLALPVWFVGSVVLGHISLGIAPQLLAWSFAVAAVVERSDSRVSATIA